jgi:hypothetical protein
MHINELILLKKVNIKTVVTTSVTYPSLKTFLSISRIHSIPYSYKSDNNKNVSKHTK